MAHFFPSCPQRAWERSNDFTVLHFKELFKSKQLQNRLRAMLDFPMKILWMRFVFLPDQTNANQPLLPQRKHLTPQRAAGTGPKTMVSAVCSWAQGASSQEGCQQLSPTSSCLLAPDKTCMCELNNSIPFPTTEESMAEQ